MAATAATTSRPDSLHRVIDDGPVSGQQLLVVALCLSLNMLDGFDITAMSVVAGSVAGELGLAADQLGLIFSFALLGMTLGAMLIAPLSDLFGRRALIVASVVLVGASIALTSRADSLLEFITLRFISGLGAGAMLACQATLAAEYSPEKYRALSVAAVTAGYPLGATLTSVVAAWVVPDYGWRGMFLAGGLATLLLGFVAWLLMPESLKYLIERRPRNALARANKILMRLSREPVKALPAVEDAAPTLGFGKTLLALLAPAHRRTTLTMWLVFFLCFATLYFLMSWIPKLMEDAGYSAAAGRQAFFLFNLGGFFGVFTMGVLATRLMLTHVISALKFAGAVGMLAFALIPKELSVLLVLFFVVGFTMQGGFTGMYSVAAKAYPTSIRSTGIGWCIGLGRFGAVAGPYVAGLLIAGGLGLEQNFVIFALPLAVGALIAFSLRIR